MATRHLKVASKPAAAGTVQWLRDHISSQEPHAEVISLTPALASVLLKNNPDNRNIRPRKVKHFAHDMAAGNWPLNGETIILSREGMVNDGQHRLLAVVEANLTIPATIFFNAERETRTTVDQGSSRNAAAYMSMEGIPNSTSRTSVTRMILAYEASDGKDLTLSDVFTATDIVDRATNDAMIAKCCARADSLKSHTKAFAAPRIIGFCDYILRHVDEDDAERFMDQVIYGESLGRKDPAYTVRERMLSIGKIAAKDKIEILFRGWIAFRHRRPLTIAKVMGGDLPDPDA